MDKSILFKEFKTALTEEIKYIKETGGDARFILRDGQLVDNDGGNFIYEFITDTPLELGDDTPINIKHGEQSVTGSIVAVNGLKVLLGLNEDIGSRITEMVITASPYFLLELLQERIDDVESKKLSFNTELAMKTFGFQGSSVAEDNNFLTSLDELKPRISKEQEGALAKSLGSEITFIWGPPGTGKTTTLSYLANELLLRDKSILLVSHTNVAIDNALERIAQILKQKEDDRYLNGSVLRVGTSPNKEFFDNFPELSVDYWVKEKSKELNEKLTELEERLNKEIKLLEKLNDILKMFGHISQTEVRIKEFKTNIETTKKKLANTEVDIQKIQNEIIDKREKLRKAEQASFFGRLMAGLNPKKLERLASELSLSLEEENSKLSKLHQRLKIQEDNLRAAERVYTEYKDRLNEIRGEEEIPLVEENKILERINKQKETIKEFNQQIETLKNIIQELTHNIIRSAKLIGTTVTKGYLNQDIYERNFDVVIVDEASMVPLPALFFNCGLATSRVIVIGDFRQLAPIAMAKDKFVEKWLKRDIFEVAGITKKINEGREEEKLAILNEQRRMPKEIAGLVNTVVYKDNPLITKEKPPEEKKKEKEVFNSKPFSGEKVVLCDTSEFNPWCTKSPSQRSPFNVYTALLSVYLAEQALLNGVDSIAILTPYRAQNNLIHKLVADKDKALTGDKFKNVVPASVHRFQGRESELIIFDLVEGPMRQIRWLAGEFDTDAMRLINVAITRARAKIIFIANLKYLKNKLKSTSILKQVLANIEESYPVINTQEFFPFIKIPLKRVESVKLDDTVPQFCNEAFFYKAFHKDLSEAKSEVVIISPFVTQNRIATFEPIFRELNRKQVKTFIITKSFREQNISKDLGEEIKDNLKKLRVELITRPLSHEKLAIIDGKIIWHGSLNILSHKNTSELMVRFTTKEDKFAQETLKLCGINIPKIIEEKIINKRIKELNKSGVGFCSRGHSLVIKRGAYGLFLSCSEFPRCRETMQPTKDLIAEVFGQEYLSCERCGSAMEIKFNPKRKSRFLGCSKYPDCRFTRPL